MNDLFNIVQLMARSPEMAILCAGVIGIVISSVTIYSILWPFTMLLRYVGFLKFQDKEELVVSLFNGCAVTMVMVLAFVGLSILFWYLGYAQAYGLPTKTNLVDFNIGQEMEREINKNFEALLTK